MKSLLNYSSSSLSLLIAIEAASCCQQKYGSVRPGEPFDGIGKYTSIGTEGVRIGSATEAGCTV